MKSKSQSTSQSGFTLIELLVVIGIIGLLASIIVVAVKSARENAKVAKMQNTFKEISDQIEAVRDSQNMNLHQITGAWCSDCTVCRGNGDLRGIPLTHPCMVQMAYTFGQLGFFDVPIDPWGAPYLIDENDGEYGADESIGLYGCEGLADVVYSAGPDGNAYLNGDDIKHYVPPFTCLNYDPN